MVSVLHSMCAQITGTRQRDTRHLPGAKSDRSAWGGAFPVLAFKAPAPRFGSNVFEVYVMVQGNGNEQIDANKSHIAHTKPFILTKQAAI